MNNSLVSVIVPTYNRPKMLSECLRSIANQTFRDFEIIVINDAGEDVGDTIKQFNGSLNISYICHDKNKGLGAARNTGLRATKGKYIAYLDDDDLFYPEHLETLVTFLEKSQFKVAYTDAYQVTQELSGKTYKVLSKELILSENFDKERFLSENYIPILCVIHECSCLRKTGLFDETQAMYADWDLWIRMSQRYDFYHIKRVTSEYRVRSDNMSSTTSKQHLADYIYIYNKYSLLTKDKPQIRKHQKLQLMKMEAAKAQQEGDYSLAIEKYKEIITLSSKCISAGYNKPRSESFFHLGAIYSQQGKFSEAEEELKKALSLEPFDENITTSIHYAMGSNYERQGRLNEAIERFNYVVNNGPLSIKFAGGAHFHLGCIYKELGEKEKAKHHFEESLKFIPNHKKAKEYLELAADD